MRGLEYQNGTDIDWVSGLTVAGPSTAGHAVVPRLAIIRRRRRPVPARLQVTGSCNATETVTQGSNAACSGHQQIPMILTGQPPGCTGDGSGNVLVRASDAGRIPCHWSGLVGQCESQSVVVGGVTCLAAHIANLGHSGGGGCCCSIDIIIYIAIGTNQLAQVTVSDMSERTLCSLLPRLHTDDLAGAGVPSVLKVTLYFASAGSGIVTVTGPKISLSLCVLSP